MKKPKKSARIIYLPIDKLNKDTVHLIVGDVDRARRIIAQHIANSGYWKGGDVKQDK